MTGQRQEVVVGRAATIGVQLYADEARTESSEPVAVRVQRSTGEDVLPAGTATTTPAGTTGRYEVKLDPAAMTEVDILTATWSVTLDGVAQTRRTTVEVAGGYYFELAELRAMPGLSDTTKYPTAKLAEARTRAQDEVEREIGVAFVERYEVVTLNRCSGSTAWLRPFVRRVLSGTVNGVALTEDQIAAMTAHDYGRLDWLGGWFADGSVLRLVHAYSPSPPTEIRALALDLARHQLLGWRSSVPNQPVDADELGRETPAGESADRGAGPGITAALRAWRLQHIGPTIA